MKEYTSDKIRNVAVLSHDGAGKTAVVESLLLACGAVDAVGVGKDNKHIMDYEPEEIKRNVTIQLSIAPCEWEGYKLNFLDTPGYSEFVAKFALPCVPVTAFCWSYRQNQALKWIRNGLGTTVSN